MNITDLQNYKDILDLVPCGICRVALDDDLTILYANQCFYEIYGYSVHSAVEKGFKSAKFILLESDYQMIYEVIQKHIKNGDNKFQLEYRGVHSSGKLMWLVVQCVYYPERPGSMLCALVDIGEQKKIEEELRISMQESRIAFRLTDKLMYLFDVQERRLYQPQSVVREFGLPETAENVPHSIAESRVVDEESKEQYIHFYESIIRGEPEGQTVVKKRKMDGTFVWHSAKYSVIYDDEGKPRRAVISCEDITKQREKELVYQKWSQYFKAQEGKTIGYYEYNLTKNVMEEDAGDAPPDYLRPLKTYTQTVNYIAEHFIYKEHKERFCTFFNRERLLTMYYDGQMGDSLDYLRKRADGSLYWVRVTIQLIADPYRGDVRLFMMSWDIDKERKEALELRNLAEHDSMTGILNRETFISKVSAIIGSSDETMCHALIMLDIDKFKVHNDSHGHQFGDLVIKETAQRLKNFLRNSDLCGRVGGDEFMVFLNAVSSKTDIEPRIEGLCKCLRQKYPKKDEVSCSMGAAFYPDGGKTFHELYQNADLALYEAKKESCGGYKIYHGNQRGAAEDMK